MLVHSFRRTAAPGCTVAQGWADVVPAARQTAATATLQPAALRTAAPAATAATATLVPSAPEPPLLQLPWSRPSESQQHAAGVPQPHGPAHLVEPDSAGLLLEADPRAVGRGRRWVCERAEALGATDDALGVVELLTSELVTNAVRYGPADGVVAVDTRCVDGSLLVTVTDDGGQVPVVCDPDLDEVSGRGLMLVQQLAHDWGFTALPGHGTAVWFEIRLAVA